MDHHQKLSRAAFHFDALQDTMEAFLNDNPYTLVAERDGPSGMVVRFRCGVPVPDKLPLILGDFLYNCRAALEHLAFSLVHANTPAPKKADKITFPIFRDRDRYLSEGRPKVAEASGEALAAIDSLQPFRASDPPESDPLWVLYELSNLDRHRKLFVCGAVVSGSSVSVEIDGRPFSLPNRAQVPPGPFQDGAEVARFYVVGWGKAVGQKSKVIVNTKIDYQVSFAERWPPQSGYVIPTLDRVFEHIRTVVFPRLDPFTSRNEMSRVDTRNY